MTLDAQLTDHRAMYQADLMIPHLVSAPRVGSHRSTRPPTTFDYSKELWVQEPADANGMNLAARLVKYLSHPEGYGSDFPWSKALFRLKWHCRKEHPYHRASDRPYWRGSLCWQLVTFVIVRGWSVHNAAEILRYDNPEPVLRTAMAFIEAAMDDARRKAEKRSREDEGHGPGAVPAPEWRHHAPSDEHVAVCPNPICRERRAA